jgi:hypothetical protein
MWKVYTLTIHANIPTIKIWNFEMVNGFNDFNLVMINLAMTNI